MQVNSLHTKQAASIVLGLGATGLSCLEYLHNKERLIACDDNISVERQAELQNSYTQVEFSSIH